MAVKIYDMLQAATADGILADSTQVRGGYMAITSKQIANLTSAQKVAGTLVYEIDTGKTYRYTSDNIACKADYLGDGDNSFTTGSTAIALGQNSFATGLNTLAGSKAFTILSINSNNKTFTLDSVEGLEVNDVYSAFLVNNTTSKQFENYGKITAINANENVVTVDIFPTVTEIVTADSYINDAGYDSEENSFRIILKPTVGTRTIGANTFASGSGSKALSKNSAAFGVGNTAHGSHSFVAGSGNTVNYASAAFGRNNKAIYDQSMAFGGGNTASGYSSLATGQGTQATGITSSSFGFNTNANGNQSMATGEETKATGQRSFTGGYKSQATNTNAFAIGENTRATGENSVSIGKETQATGNRSFTTGFKTVSSGTNSSAFGNEAQAKGHHSMAVGSLVVSYGSCSHAEGQSTKRTTVDSLKSKDNIINYWKTNKVNVAYGDRSHVEGQDNLVTASNAHAEGQNNLVTGAASHAEGNYNKVSGLISHAEGNYTIAASNNQHVQGKYNIADTEHKYAHIVGNGENGVRSNAHTLDWNGNAWFAGKLTQKGTPENNNDLTTKSYVDNLANNYIKVTDYNTDKEQFFDTNVVSVHADKLSKEINYSSVGEIYHNNGYDELKCNIYKVCEYPENGQFSFDRVEQDETFWNPDIFDYNTIHYTLTSDMFSVHSTANCKVYSYQLYNAWDYSETRPIPGEPWDGFDSIIIIAKDSDSFSLDLHCASSVYTHKFYIYEPGVYVFENTEICDVVYSQKKLTLKDDYTPSNTIKLINDLQTQINELKTQIANLTS